MAAGPFAYCSSRDDFSSYFFQLAINTVPVSINQDMRLFLPLEGLLGAISKELPWQLWHGKSLQL